MKRIGTLVVLTAVVSTSAFSQILRHEVRPGETLYGIARRYEISVDLLSDGNDLESPELLLPGTLLTIPNRYAVERGDTLFSIARRFETTVAALSDVNALPSSDIRVGQVLVLPEDASAAAVAIAANEEGTAADTTPREEANRDDPGQPRTDRVADDDRDASTITVAADVSEPISFADGGVWPVAGNRRRLNGKLPGVMITAERGSPVYAISSGRVVYAGPHTTFGNVVFIQSSQDYVYVYGGQESVGVTVGEMITAGDPIGTVGISPSEGNAALYFSVWRNDRFVDPESAPRG